MLKIFYRNRQLLVLSIALIIVWGVSSFLTLPRLEDPEIVQRAATITTLLPGATPERIETLVTQPLENELFELDEVESLESTSSAGISVIVVELRESIRNVEPVWSKVRSKIDDAASNLPEEASSPVFEDTNVSASALMVGLTWELDTPVNYAILGRFAEFLEDELRAIPGTDTLERFGEPQEEIQVLIAPSELSHLGLSPQGLIQQISASDAKISAGQLRTENQNILFETDSSLDSLERIRQIPIQTGRDGQVALLGAIAQVTKGRQEPPATVAIVDGHPAVVIAATVESQRRVDVWAEQAHRVLEDFQTNISDGLGLHIILDQSLYVQQRLNGVIWNLVLSSLLVIGISLVMLGLKSSLIVGAALPLSTFMVFGGMKAMAIPLHQISVTGIIIALGLLIDNAIIAVDEMQIRFREGMSPAEAVGDTIRYLAIPLGASTLTTVLTFVPIASSPGGTGEFIGTIGTTVILALSSSLILSLTVIPAIAGLAHDWRPSVPWPWLQDGVTSESLNTIYQGILRLVLRRPWLGVGCSLLLPVIGFTQFTSLEQQFFPPTNRDQFYIEFILPVQTAIAQTEANVLQARQLIQNHENVENVHWFLGKSAPAFFYNVIAERDNAANYAQGLVQLKSTRQIRETITDLQYQLDHAFPDAQVLVRQLEQGPPFSAPIELRLYGPDLNQLREVGNQLRAELSQIEGVIHTQSDLTEALPKLMLSVDEVQARRAGLTNAAIAQQLNTALEGSTGGSILEGEQDIPVRVRLDNERRGNLQEIRSFELVSEQLTPVPLEAIADVYLTPDISTISHRNGQRINTVKAFLIPGSLPDTVLDEFRARLQEHELSLPNGYTIEYGGEADARGDAVGNLLSTVGILTILMAGTLILSFNSFSLAMLIASVALSAVGLALLSLKLFGALFGFTAILGTLGLIGLSVNDTIVVIAVIQADPLASQGHPAAIQSVVTKATRHVLATTFTTMIGFIPLLADPTGFWPPLAIAISGGLGGATLLALFYIPSAYILLQRRSLSSSTLSTPPINPHCEL